MRRESNTGFNPGNFNPKLIFKTFFPGSSLIFILLFIFTFSKYFILVFSLNLFIFRLISFGFLFSFSSSADNKDAKKLSFSAVR